MRFSDKACLHADLYRRFIDLECQLVAGPSAELVKSVTERRLAIEATEPPVLKVLDTLMHNELKRANGDKKSEQIEVSFW